MGIRMTTALHLPKGFILLWYGSIATIPTGYALCNGANGTPDLRDKFIVCAKQDDAGTAKTNITGALTQSGGALGHLHAKGAIAAATENAHTHNVSGTTADDSFDITVDSATEGPVSQFPHGHAFSDTSDGGTAHTHTISGNTANTNAISPYYALAYIMKL